MRLDINHHVGILYRNKNKEHYEPRYIIYFNLRIRTTVIRSIRGGVDAGLKIFGVLLRVTTAVETLVMTVQEFKPSQGEHEQLDPLPWPPSRKSAWVVKQRRPRKSASSLESPLKAESSRSVFPPSAHDNGIKHDNQKYEGFDLGQTRPRASPRAKVLESSCEQLIDIISSGRKSVKFGKSSSDGTGACDDGVSDDHGPKGAKLSRAAKLMEEDRRRIASIRSFLQNFLEGRDCSIKKRLVCDA